MNFQQHAVMHLHKNCEFKSLHMVLNIQPSVSFTFITPTLVILIFDPAILNLAA